MIKAHNNVIHMVLTLVLFPLVLIKQNIVFPSVAGFAHSQQELSPFRKPELKVFIK
jgi:hypothetical protein